MILLSFLLALIFTLTILSLTRFPSRIALILGGYLVFFGQIVFIFLIANSLHALTNKWLVLAIQVILLLAGGFAWLHAGRPSLRYLLPNRWKFSVGWQRGMKDWLPVVLLGLGVAMAFLLGAVLIVVVAPNNNDALAGHLSRIGFWLQHSSFLPWPTFNYRGAVYPLNASLQVYWTVLFWGTDQLAGFVQWVGGIITILCVFGLARLMGWSRLQSAFAAFVWGSLPLVLLQSTTAQLDLVAAGIFMPVIYFLVLGVRSENRAMLGYSGLSLALAVGTKQTLWFLLPGLGLFVLILIGYWKRHVQHLLVWIGVTALFFVVLSSYMFVVNEIYYKTPVGPSDIVSQQSLRLTPASVVQTLVYNIPRLAYQALDFSGLPDRVRLLADKAKGKLTGHFVHWIGFPIEGTTLTATGHNFDLAYQPPVTEDESWFGLLSVCLLFPAAVMEFISGLRKKDVVKVGLFVFGLVYLLVDVLLRPGWDPYQGRYFITAVGVLAPFMARWVQRSTINKVAVWISVMVGIMTIYTIMVYNPAKPLRSDRVNIFQASRMVAQGLQGGSMRGYMQMVYSLPDHAVIAYYVPSDYFWDYPLFGEHFTRKVIPLMSLSALRDISQLQALGIEFVYVDLTNAPPLDNIDPRLEEYTRQDNQWAVYQLK